jgi:zinc protease
MTPSFYDLVAKIQRRAKRPRLAVLAGLAMSVVAATNAQPARPPTPISIRIPFEHVTLSNGLNVILSPDHSIPQVTVDVWYHVGSKNEVPGRTGFAHMFEHVMFTGSAHAPYGLLDRLTESVGGNNNGSTTNDRTHYYENIPSNYLESTLWLEADRMGCLLEKLDEAKFAAQRDIVQNERRQGIDNQPYGRTVEVLEAAMMSESNPYSWPVVGYMSDLQKATVEDVKQFFRLYYAPSNATLAVVGDFDPAQTKAWVTKYFGDLKRGGPISRPKVIPPVLVTERRLVFEDRVQVARLSLAWPTVGDDNDDNFAFQALALILTGPRTARLTKTLVYDLQSAANITASNNAAENAGYFTINVTPRPGHSLAELEGNVDSVIEHLKRDGPTDSELAKTRAGLEFGFVSRLQSNYGKAQILNDGFVFHGDAAHYQTVFTKLQAVTGADVKRVANKYLGPGRVVLSTVPLGKADQASKLENSRKVTVSPDGGHYLMGREP